MKRRPTHTDWLGSIMSDRSYRAPDYDRSTPEEDLIADMSNVLCNLMRTSRVPRERRKRFTALLRYGLIGTLPDVRHTIGRLAEALATFAPADVWFGERDGDWGFWLRQQKMVCVIPSDPPGAALPPGEMRVWHYRIDDGEMVGPFASMEEAVAAAQRASL